MTQCYCDYEPADLYYPSFRRARKPYSCAECAAPIAVGEKYEYVFGVWDGNRDSFRTCANCVDLRTWVENNVPCACWAHGNLIEDLGEAVAHAAKDAPLETVGLRFGFLRRSFHEAARRKRPKFGRRK